jgi:hypothetical protein
MNVLHTRTVLSRHAACTAGPGLQSTGTHGRMCACCQTAECSCSCRCCGASCHQCLQQQCSLGSDVYSSLSKGVTDLQSRPVLQVTRSGDTKKSDILVKSALLSRMSAIAAYSLDTEEAADSSAATECSSVHQPVQACETEAAVSNGAHESVQNATHHHSGSSVCQSSAKPASLLWDLQYGPAAAEALSQSGHTASDLGPHGWSAPRSSIEAAASSSSA